MMFTKRNDRVADEAAALAAARHPGVVELVDVVDGALRTRLVDGRPLRELGPLPANQVAGLAAAVATTLADLHDLGEVHGGIDASHVLVTGDGRPVLCSLGRRGVPADDVAALGRLVTAQLAAAPGEEPGRRRLGRRRLGRRRLGRRRLGALLAPPAGPTLAALAVEAAADDPAVRPSARALAEAIGRRIPAACLPRPASRPTPLPNVARSPSPRRGRWRRGVPAAGVTIAGGFVGLAAVLGVLGLLALAGTWALSRPTSRPTPAPTAPHRDAAMPGPPPTPMATRVWPTEPLDFHDGVLTYGGVRYALGQPADVLVAGDWRCTGHPTLALLRRGPGDVFAFDGWPDGKATLVARSLGQIAGATSLRVVDVDGDGCHELEVERSGAAPVHLRIGS